MPCFAPSEVVTPQAAALVGRIAERVIADEYLVNMGRSTFFPASLTDYSDIHSGFANVTLFIGFLKGNNPSLTTSQLLWLRLQSGLLKVPDLCTHSTARREFYEIKPASPDGLAAGWAKIAALDALFSFVGLSYKAGTFWSPSVKIELANGLILGCRIKILLHFWRHANGLVLYELCVEGQLQELAGKIALAVLLAACVAILLAMIPKPLPA